MNLWTVMACEDCGYYFAIFKDEPNFQSCPHCGSEETTGTGEYLSSALYTKSGKLIQKGDPTLLTDEQKEDVEAILDNLFDGYRIEQSDVKLLRLAIQLAVGA